MLLTKNPDRDLILSAFDHAASTYEAHGHVNQVIARHFWSFASLHLPNEFSALMDLGCGPRTFLPNSLMDKTPCILIDGAPHMVMQAHKNNQQAKAMVMDVAHPAFYCPQGVALSNMTFQWMDDLGAVIERYKSRLKMLGFSIPILGSFREWISWCVRHDVPERLNPLKTEESLRSLCESIMGGDVHLHVEDVFVHYERPIEFALDLKGMGAHIMLNPQKGSLKRSLYAARLKDDHFNGVTYKVAFVLMNFGENE